MFETCCRSAGSSVMELRTKAFPKNCIFINDKTRSKQNQPDILPQRRILHPMIHLLIKFLENKFRRETFSRKIKVEISEN